MFPPREDVRTSAPARKWVKFRDAPVGTDAAVKVTGHRHVPLAAYNCRLNRLRVHGKAPNVSCWPVAQIPTAQPSVSLPECCGRIQGPRCKRGCGQSACPCPRRSHVHLFGDGEGIVNFDAEIPHGALHLGMAKQKLNRSEIARATVDQRRLGPAQGMGTEQLGVEADAADPIGNQAGILPGRDGAFAPTTAGE
jgi:hypothetical protein